MAENKNNCPADENGFREAVCIDAGRVYDSCVDRDCLEDLRCFFAPEVQSVIENSISVRLRSAEVLNTSISVEPVPFNKGFYSCDLTFFFLLEFDLYKTPHGNPITVRGVSSFNKKVILFGSEGNVKVFSSTLGDFESENLLPQHGGNAPKCVVQCVDPVALSARIGVIHDCYENVRCMPQCVNDCVGGQIVTELPAGNPTIYATIGLFTIIQLIRNVQMLIPVYDFCIPEKQCDNTTDQPCDVFRRIQFPTDDFFPPRPCNVPNCGCGCHGSNVGFYQENDETT